MSSTTELKIVVGNVLEDNALNLQDTASRLGITVVGPEHAEHAQYLVATDVLPRKGKGDPYLVSSAAPWTCMHALISTELVR